MDFFYKVVLRHDTGLGEAYMDQVCVRGGGGGGGSAMIQGSERPTWTRCV